MFHCSNEAFCFRIELYTRKSSVVTRNLTSEAENSLLSEESKVAPTVWYKSTDWLGTRQDRGLRGQKDGLIFRFGSLSLGRTISVLEKSLDGLF